MLPYERHMTQPPAAVLRLWQEMQRWQRRLELLLRLHPALRTAWLQQLHHSG
jgi:hypothetical protein